MNTKALGRTTFALLTAVPLLAGCAKSGDLIAAVVIGGTLLIGGAGSVGGTVCGVLLLGVIQNVINQIGNLTSSIQSVVSGAFLVVVVVTQTYLSRVRRL
jgi:ribose transport system permease protein